MCTLLPAREMSAPLPAREMSIPLSELSVSSFWQELPNEYHLPLPLTRQESHRYAPSDDLHDGSLEQPNETSFPHLLGQPSPLAPRDVFDRSASSPRKRSSHSWMAPKDISLALLPRPTPTPSHAARKPPQSRFVFGESLCPGDVLYVPGGNGGAGLADLGTLGGLFGHVLLALEAPVRVPRGSEEAEELEPLWPSDDVSELWIVRTLECNRGSPGLHQATLVLYVVPCGGLKVAGEIEVDDLSLLQVAICDEHVELWASPEQLREPIQNIFDEVVREMLQHTVSWSFSTAARAFISPVQSYSLVGKETISAAEKDRLMHEILQSWQAAPICTSVIVGFWQRYLWKLVREAGLGVEPIDVLLKWMPLRADRVLPGAMLKVMQQCGWIRVVPPPAVPKSVKVPQGIVRGLIQQWNGMARSDPVRLDKPNPKSVPRTHARSPNDGAKNRGRRKEDLGIVRDEFQQGETMLFPTTLNTTEDESIPDEGCVKVLLESEQQLRNRWVMQC